MFIRYNVCLDDIMSGASEFGAQVAAEHALSTCNEYLHLLPYILS